MAEETSHLRWRNWSREQRCNPWEIAHPRTREGLIRTVVDAVAAGRRVKVAGSGHSFSPAPLTDGTMVGIELLDRILDLDPVSRTVRVEAGVVLGDLNRRLHEHGVALENLGDIDRQTLAGSISTATHGTGARFGNLSSQVVAMEVVGPDGTLHELTEAGDADALRAARVGLGALGAIYSVTLRTVGAYRIERVDRPVPLAEVLGDLDGHADAHDHFEFYVFPHTETALCRESARTQAPPEPRNRAAAYAHEVVLENWIGAGFAAAARAVPAAAPRLAGLASRGVGRSRTLDDGFRVFASERRIRFTEMEYAIPREHAREAIERVLEIAGRPELGIAYPIEVRFVAADDALLSPSHDLDACYIAVHSDRAGRWSEYFGAVAEVMNGYGGRPHWGKRHFLGHRELSGLYPRWEDFRRVRARLDPEGSFANDYTDRVLGPLEAESQRKA